MNPLDHPADDRNYLRPEPYILTRPVPRTSTHIMSHPSMQSLRRMLPALVLIGFSSCVRVGASSRPDPAPEPAATETIQVVEATPARPPEHAEVMRTVGRLFDGMKAGDSAIVRSVFDSGARLVTVAIRNGVPRIEAGSLDNFVKAVGTPHADVWDERISDEVVQVDGPLATAWMRYRFYAGSSFSHCGVNSFELIRRADGWRITSIADTRRREGCGGTGE